MPVSEGSIITGAGGRRYVLSRSDGQWAAQYLPVLARVPLGTSGRAITLELRESGEYWWGGIVESGLTVRAADNILYRLDLSDGTWTAVPLESTLQVPLGDSGEMVSLNLLPNGTYTHDGRPVTVGYLVTSSSGARYELTETDGRWSAQPFMDSDGTGGGSAVPPRPPTPDIVSDVLTTSVGRTPTLVSTESGERDSVLQVGGLEYVLASLAPGQAVTKGDTFARKAHSAISVRRRQIDLYEIVYADRPDDLRQALQEIWDSSRSDIQGLFGEGASEVFDLLLPQDSQGRVDVEEVEATIDAVTTALATYGAFRAGLDEGGILEGALAIESAEAAFDAVTEWSALQFNATSNTRFGAYMRYRRPEDSTWEESLVLLAGEEGHGAFAYSPLKASVLAGLPIRGSASYAGRTVAVAPAGGFATYTGMIDLHVRFANRTVNATVRGLTDDIGETLEYAHPVAEISLPLASLGPDASFGVERVNGLLLYESLSDTPMTQALPMSFAGQLLGRGAAAGTAVIGTWALVTSLSDVPLLTGSFGAERRTVSEPGRPSTDNDGQTGLTFVGARPASSGNIAFGGADAAGNPLAYEAGALFTDGSATIVGPTLTSQARAVLEDLSATVAGWTVADGDPQVDAQRASLWSQANQTITSTLFGDDARAANILGAIYPVGTNRDSRALEHLDLAVNALASADAFGASLQPGAVFANARDVIQDADAAFNATAYRVQAAYGHTNYGRFGVWARTAWSSASDTGSPDATSPSGSFAYSPLSPVVFGTSTLSYPSGGVGSFVGRTVAMSAGGNPTGYEGNMQVSVTWGQALASASLRAVISGLASRGLGDPLTYEGTAIDQITFSGVRLRAEADGSAGFADTSHTVTLRLAGSLGGGTAWSGDREITGRFVGAGPGGPHGVIGTWNLGFGVPVEGAFGADLGP